MLLAIIEHSSLARAIKASFLVYPLISAAHILAIGAVLTSVILMDLRILGVLSPPEDPFDRLLRRVALIGFAGAVVTGFAMFAIRATDYAALPIFLIKMGLIALAIVNFLVFLALDRKGKAGLRRVAALLSMVLWLCVLVCGRMIGFM